MRNSIFKSYTKKILRSEAFISVIIVFVLALGIIGTSYALYMDVDTDTNYQLVEVGDLSIGFDNGENTITLENMTPMEDEIALENSDNIFSFYIYNSGNYTVDYDISLVADNTNGNTIAPEYINYQICKDNAENCTEIKTLGTNNLIYTDALSPKRESDVSNPSAYYFLRLWINNQYKETSGGTIKYNVEISAKNASGYLDNKNTLAGAILNNPNIIINNTVPSFDSIADYKITGDATSGELGLFKAEDDYGVSYYFRGAQSSNYVNFAGMCWRIVRIDGNGNTKLILEDQDEPCSETMNGDWGIPTTTDGNFGYTEYNKNALTASDGTQNSETLYIMDYLHGQTNSAGSMATAFKNFQNTFTETELSKLKAGNWCLGDAGYSRTGSLNSDYTYTLLNETQKMDYKIKGTIFYYDSYVRLSGENKYGFQPTLKCNGTIMNDWDDNETNPTPMYVGGITADEMVYAGASSNDYNENFYLINDSFKKYELDYEYFWSLSPLYFSSSDDYAFNLDAVGSLGNDVVYNTFAFRPAISLVSGIKISGGSGTQSEPYTIN